MSCPYESLFFYGAPSDAIGSCRFSGRSAERILVGNEMVFSAIYDEEVGAQEEEDNRWLLRSFFCRGLVINFSVFSFRTKNRNRAAERTCTSSFALLC